MRIKWQWPVVVLASNLAMWGMLGLMQTTAAPPQGAQVPFANPSDQREEIVKELREIKALLKEQNAILAAGGRKAEAPAR